MKKRVFCFLLLTALLLSACQTAAPTESGGTETESTESSGSEAMNQTAAYIEQIDAMYRYEVEREGMSRRLISTEKTVTASLAYTGEISVLTDGKFLSEVTQDDLSGAICFEGRNDTELVLDMGKTVNGVSDFGLSILYSASLHSTLPRQVKFSVSTDGITYTEVGTVYRPNEILENQSNVFDLRLQMGVDARYIKAVIPGSAFMTDKIHIDEFCVYEYQESDEEPEQAADDSYYQNAPLPAVSENLFWAEDEEGYQTFQNLAKGLPYRITSGGEIEDALRTDYYNTPVSNMALTDGVNAPSPSFTDSRWFHFTRFISRTVIFDLEKVSGISKVEIGFLRDEEVGIRLPTSVKVAVSYDGVSWSTIASGSPRQEDPRDGTSVHRLDFSLEFDETQARFVAVEIGVDSHVWLDEIAVFGKKDASAAAVPEFSDENTPESSGYISPDALGGTENIMLMYTFKNESPETGLNTAEEILPYVAYMDKQGNVVDSFFDAFLFLPCMTICPSGGRLYYYEEAPANMSDWLAFEEDLFYQDCNVNGLEIAAGQMNEALGTETQVPIYFSIFSTVYGDKNFGDVDGDGINEDFSNLEDRKKVVKWWIDRLIARYESGGYQNIKLDGFYWYHEELSGDQDEAALIRYTAEYLHSLGYYFIWIPYYQASGFSEWQSLGFDAAVMQPNYMFSEDVPTSRLYTNAEYAKMYGMGVEIEADYGVVSDYDKLEKYRAYLRAGVETGYMHSIKMYYQDGGPGVFYSAYKSTTAAFRSVYDDTYKYAKGILTLDPPALAETEFIRLAGDSVVLQLATADGCMALDLSLYLAPKYGSVKDMGDGMYIYYPPEGFTGTDSFVILNANGSHTQTVEITVTLK